MATVKSLVTCLIGSTRYLIHPQKLGSIQETIKPDALLPVTLLETHEIFGNVDDTLRRFQSWDDVFAPEFGFVLVEKPAANSSRAVTTSMTSDKELYRLTDGRELNHAASLASQDLTGLPSGPYFLQGPNLHQAWRLYDDTADAFTLGVVPENVTQISGFRAIDLLSESGAHRSVAVPSRLYYPRMSEEKPLSGLRIAVPDSVALKGVPTSLSSRAWRSLVPSAADTTAALAQRLMDLGAVVVGKTKSSQFASGREWVDEQAPWSPRADGYQRVIGAAAGAGAALASYEWLAAALAVEGIDGLGHVHALFSLRSTPASVPLNETQVSSRLYDAIGLMGRTMAGLSRVASALLTSPNGSGDTPSLPRRIVYPIDAEAPEDQQKLASPFLRILEKESDHKVDTVNMTAVWAEHRPVEARGQSLHAYIKDSAFRSSCYDFYHEYDDFRNAYQERHHKTPYAEATTKYRWETGKNVSKQQYDEHQKRLAIFRKWFDVNVAAQRISSDGWTAVAVPVSSEGPSYRDEPPATPSPPKGLLLSWMLRAPEVRVPFAHLPYESRIGGRKEYRAVYGSVMGPPGSDLSALHFVREALDKAGWRTVVETGRLAFPEQYVPPGMSTARKDLAMAKSRGMSKGIRNRTQKPPADAPPMIYRSVPSKHSRAARRATSPSINTDKSLKEATLPRQKSERPSVLAIHQAAGVQKKTRPPRKSRLSTKARRRHDKGLEMAEAVGERTAAKTLRSVGRARVARDRRKPWDDVNKAAREDDNGSAPARAGGDDRDRKHENDDLDSEMDEKDREPRDHQSGTEVRQLVDHDDDDDDDDDDEEHDIDKIL
ncbi:hypothetical protein L249_7778 [Ophiocordyceps polyrhachis-furcata BCC 54312]|uniref:Amidase domain-containing protein n=1 Tax=Ophiocordyceps polyrhachis-furcata BCC 54312 TaxID=1330021 RepID=A0A367LB61_9HYPO|nr:hypothetical protein L249_7778 [Ophiocordyceps polyrhachis-furcata BCC 54312]